MAASILIADDERGIRELLERALVRSGYTITLAANGEEALEHVRKTEFDVVITDVRMPGADGIAVLNATKQTAPDTEVVVATAYAEIETAIACVRGGAFDFVHKPFSAEDVLITIARALERRDLRTANALYTASQAILATSQPKRLPQVIVEVAVSAMSADYTALFLFDAGDRLYLAHAKGEATSQESMTGQVEQVAKTIAASRNPMLERADSRVVYPLTMGDRVLGALVFDRHPSRRPFRKHDLYRASVLASQVLLALENARLLQHATTSERLAAIGQLAASVTYEVNEPITSIVANHALLREQLEKVVHMDGLVSEGTDIETLQRTRLALGGSNMLDEVSEVLSAAEAGASRIRDIVRDMRALARSDHDNPTRFDLNDAIRSALRLTSAGLHPKATIKLDLGSEVDVLGHVGRLSQVFVNLLLNASQAMPENASGRGEITVTSRKNGDQIIAEVSDNGPGIPPDLLPHLFEAYFSTLDALGGGGLGLSLSREIVRRHRGDLTARSTLGAGATFTVVLPAAS